MRVSWKASGILLVVCVILAAPSAAADVSVFASYRDGPTSVCVAYDDTDGLSFDDARCSSTRIAHVEAVGEIGAGARAGGVTVCVLLDDDGQLHIDCNPCALLAEVANIRLDDGLPACDACGDADLCGLVILSEMKTLS